MSTAEVVDVAPAPSGPPSGKALFRNLHTREFLGHKKKVSVPSFSFLPFSPHFTICNELRVEIAARNESDAFSTFKKKPFPSFNPLLAEFRTRALQFQGFSKILLVVTLHVKLLALGRRDLLEYRDIASN